MAPEEKTSHPIGSTQSPIITRGNSITASTDRAVVLREAAGGGGQEDERSVDGNGFPTFQPPSATAPHGFLIRNAAFTQAIPGPSSICLVRFFSFLVRFDYPPRLQIAHALIRARHHELNRKTPRHRRGVIKPARDHGRVQSTRVS